MNWQVDRNRNWSELLVADSPQVSARVTVLAAHPDDEAIGASVLLARHHNASVIFLTDGAPRDRRLWPKSIRGSREEYAKIRREEAQNALAQVGVSSRQVTWLGGVDQEAILAVPQLAARLSEALHTLQPQFVVTHPYEGGHPDHDCAALLASIAVSRLGKRTSVLEMTSYHARDGQLITGEFLEGNSDAEITVELSVEEKTRKQKMFHEYRTQHEVLKDFRVDYERLRSAPEYDFRQAPHQGKLWYECLGWEMTGERWRSLAGSALEREFSCP